MKIVSNSIQPNNVDEETRNGDRYLIVRDVPFVRAMNLAGGYVPESEIEGSTPDWERKDLTANHPRNKPNKPWYRPILEDDQPISVNTDPEVKQEYSVGELEDPYYDGTWINGDFTVNADVAEAMGGHASDIVEKIENGEPFDVSSQYIPKQLPEGEYDGKYRSNVEGIKEPDSIALLPHKRGQCSIESGCGINPKVAANSSEVRIPVSDDPAGASTSSSDFDIQNPSDEAKRTLGERVMGLFGWDEQTANEGAESSADTDSDMKDEDKIDYLVANSAYDRDNLEAWDGTDCLINLYETVKANNEDETEEQETEETDDENMNENEPEVVEMTEEEFNERIDARVEERAEELVANREQESEKEEIAKEIVANSAEYDDTDSVTEDFPTVASLETKRDQVSDSGTLPGSGPTGNAQGGNGDYGTGEI